MALITRLLNVATPFIACALTDVLPLEKEPLLIERLPAMLMAMPYDLPVTVSGRLCCSGMWGRSGAPSSSRST